MLGQRKIVLSILAVTGFALAAITLWLSEIIWQVGWSGTAWLWSEQYAVFGVILFGVFAYLVPIKMIIEKPWKKLWQPALELYLIGVIVFFIVKSVLYSLFSPMAIFNLRPLILWSMLAVLMLTATSSLFYVTRNNLYPVRKIFILIVIGGLVLANVLSLLSAYLFLDLSSFEAVLFESVKIGFPFFFVVLFMGLFSIFSTQKLRVVETQDREEKILDDVEFPI